MSERLFGRIMKDVGDARKPGDAIRNVRKAAGLNEFGHEIRGHGPRIKPKLHKGTQRSCPVCNPSDYRRWQRLEAKLKARAEGGAYEPVQGIEAQGQDPKRRRTARHHDP